MKTQRIEITPKTIILTLSFLLLIKFFWIIKDLVFSLFIAFIIVSALKPLVSFFVSKKLPRLIACIIVYILFLFVIVNLFVIIIPPLLGEITHLLKTLPYIIKTISYSLPISIQLDSFTQYIPNITTQAFDIVKGIFSNALFVVSTLFFGFYMLLEENMLMKTLSRFLKEEKVKTIIAIVEAAEKRMNAWFWGEITLMTVIGVMTFIGLNLIGMKYVLALSVLAGLFEVIPNIGPITSLIPAFLIGVSESYFLGFATIALYFVIQQLENHLIVPLVMKRAVGLSPIITLVALIVGGKLAGVLGVLLAVPTTLFFETIAIELIKIKKQTS